MYKQGLYHDWVPKLVQLLLIVVTFIPFMAVSCLYSSNFLDMSSGLGELSEAFSFANNAMFVGMAGAMPLLIRTKPFFRSKEVVVVGLLAMSLLCYVTSTTDNVWVIAFASLLLGFVKMFGMIEFILPIYFIITPQMDRKKFYPIFYPIAIIVGQYAGYYMGQQAYYIFWEYTNLVAIIYCLICAALSLVFMHNFRNMKKVPMHQFHWSSLILFFMAMMILNYVLSFAKYHGWYQSEVIWWGTVLFFILMVIFVIAQRSLKRPFMEIDGFAKRNVIHSLILIALMGLFMSSGGILNTYMMGVLGYSIQLTNKISLAMFPGAILGGILCFVWLKRDFRLKYLVMVGFAAFIAAQLVLYFTIAPVVRVEYFILPTVLKGLGLCVLYISLAIYCSQRLTNNQMLSAMAILVMVRSFVGQALFTAVFAWAFFKLQLQNAVNLASHMDAVDFFGQQRGGGMMLYRSVSLQSIMLSVKQLFGYTVIAGFATLFYVYIQRFDARPHLRLTFIRSLIRKVKASFK